MMRIVDFIEHKSAVPCLKDRLNEYLLAKTD